MARTACGRLAQALVLAAVCLSPLPRAQVIQIGVPDPAPTFVEDLREPTHVLGFGKGPPPGERPNERALPMTDVNGTQFVCYLPSPGSAEEGASSLASDDGGSVAAPQTPSQLLDRLGAAFCTFRVEDWWTYELCYKKKVRQYHQDPNTHATDEFVLGQYDAALSSTDEVRVDPSDVSGEAKYVSQVYSGGVVCELTGKPRETEVRYVCSPGGDTVMTSLKEPMSCSYVVTVGTPLLCQHPGFQAQPLAAKKIMCYRKGDGGGGAGADGGAVEEGSSAEGREGGSDRSASATEEKERKGAGGGEESGGGGGSEGGVGSDEGRDEL